MIGKSLAPNVHEVIHDSGVAIAKFARFEWEIGYYEAEAQAYAWIEGHSIGPQFLGHLIEEGRVIGFLIEKIEGRHAGIQDLSACESVVSRLHDLGILHGDLNKHNLLISNSCAILIDYETATKSSSKEDMQAESYKLRQQLLDEFGRGGQFIYGPEIEAQFEEIYRRDGGWSAELLAEAQKGKITMDSESNKSLLEEVRRGRTVYEG